MQRQKWVWTIFLILSLFMLTACQEKTMESNSTTTFQEETEADNTNNNSEEVESIIPTDELKEDEVENNELVATTEPKQEKRYRVNSNYFIQPVDHDQDRVVLLTFDDAPKASGPTDETGSPTFTYQILDILDKYNAKAIFFVNGHYAERNLETLLEIANRGHIIGNHTWWHLNLRKENPDTVRREIVELNDFIEEHLGERPIYFRAPFGANSEVSQQVVKEEGMQSMNWSNGSLDWEFKDPQAVVNQVISNLKKGDNILFHDLQVTADALDEILQYIVEEGYEIVLPTEVILPGE